MTTPKRKEIAQALGVDVSMVSRWAKRGLPLWSTEAAAAWRAQHIRPRLAPAAPMSCLPALPTGSPGSAMHDARLRREIAEAALAERKLQVEEGELCRTGGVRNGAATLGVVLARQVNDMPGRLSPELVGKAEKEIYKILSDWAHQYRTQVGAEIGRILDAEVPS